MEVNVNQIGGGGDKPHDCKKNNDVYNRLTNGMGESQTCKPSPSNNKMIMMIEISWNFVFTAFLFQLKRRRDLRYQTAFCSAFTGNRCFSPYSLLGFPVFFNMAGLSMADEIIEEIDPNNS